MTVIRKLIHLCSTAMLSPSFRLGQILSSHPEIHFLPSPGRRSFLPWVSVLSCSPPPKLEAGARDCSCSSLFPRCSRNSYDTVQMISVPSLKAFEEVWRLPMSCWVLETDSPSALGVQMPVKMTSWTWSWGGGLAKHHPWPCAELRRHLSISEAQVKDIGERS